MKKKNYMTDEVPPVDRRALFDALAKSGRWSDAHIISARMEWGRNRAVRACRSLIATGHLEMRDTPSKWSDVHPTREYRARADVDPPEVPPAAMRPPGIEERRADELMVHIRQRGHVTSADAAEFLGIDAGMARKVLAILYERGDVTREVGPIPLVGSQRPWIYSEVKR